MYIPINKHITTLEELIDECRQIYTGWCFKGKKNSSLTSYPGWHSSPYWDTIGRYGEDKYLLDKICNPSNNQIDCFLNFLWLRYDNKKGKVSIYRRIMRDSKETFLFNKRKYRPCNIGTNDFYDYCSNCNFHGEVLPIMTSDNCVFGEIFVISASIVDFANAGWQEEYDRAIAEKENNRRRALAQGRRKIEKVIPLADKFYYSKLMKEIPKKYGRFNSEIVQLTSLGVYSRSIYEDRDVDPSFLFSSYGYRNILNENEFIAFVIAFVCAANHVPPSELELGKVNWMGEIRRLEDGTMYIYKEDFPSYPFPGNEQSTTSAPALKYLLD